MQGQRPGNGGLHPGFQIGFHIPVRSIHSSRQGHCVFLFHRDACFGKGYLISHGSGPERFDAETAS